ncbi:universal stress protein A-like protein [Dendronephthya gigantea]|uniref:universal stress protein A-like protein n=1 Tax=Dendronephthya gigantea TaxID=151771 RepID=UPI0010694821|nr:universal stress protein A-like protein [Dendronephthya gigantea]
MAETENKDRGRVVLVAVDGSHNSENAFQWYVTHLHTPETKVFLLNVFEIPNLQSGRYHVEPESDFLSWKTRISEVEMEAQKVMKRFMDKCAAYKDLVHYTPVTVPGRPGEMICDEAAKHKADFIIIGSRGLGKISRTLFGSVSDFVVRGANRPVIVVPKGWKSE